MPANVQNLTQLSEAQLALYTSTTSPQARSLSASGAIDNTASQIFSQFDLTYNNAYDKLKNSAIGNEKSYYFGTRTTDLKDMQNDILDSVTSQVNTNIQNDSFAKRQYEINEWANSDKLDTLFVFQFVFLSLMLMAFLGYLWKINILTSGFLYFIGFIVLIINIIVIVIRSKYTRLLRNTRYWNKRKFNQYSTAPTGALPTCDQLSNGFDSLRKDFASITTDLGAQYTKFNSKK